MIARYALVFYELCMKAVPFEISLFFKHTMGPRHVKCSLIHALIRVNQHFGLARVGATPREGRRAVRLTLVYAHNSRERFQQYLQSCDSHLRTKMIIYLALFRLQT